MSPSALKIVKHAVKILQKLAQYFCLVFDHFRDARLYKFKVTRQYNNKIKQAD